MLQCPKATSQACRSDRRCHHLRPQVGPRNRHDHCLKNFHWLYSERCSRLWDTNRFHQVRHRRRRPNLRCNPDSRHHQSLLMVDLRSNCVNLLRIDRLDLRRHHCHHRRPRRRHGIRRNHGHMHLNRYQKPKQVAHPKSNLRTGKNQKHRGLSRHHRHDLRMNPSNRRHRNRLNRLTPSRCDHLGMSLHDCTRRHGPSRLHLESIWPRTQPNQKSIALAMNRIRHLYRLVGPTLPRCVCHLQNQCPCQPASFWWLNHHPCCILTSPIVAGPCQMKQHRHVGLPILEACSSQKSTSSQRTGSMMACRPTPRCHRMG